MDVVEAFRIGWREAATHHRMVNMFEPIDRHARIAEPTDDEIRRLLHAYPQEHPPSRSPEPHELSELSIG